MIPRPNVGHLVIVKHTKDTRENSLFDNLGVGDIIVLNTPYKTTEGKQKIIVHRVAEIITDAEGQRIIEQKEMPILVQFPDYIIP